MARRLNAAQRRLRKQLDELTELCRLRGISSEALRQNVHDVFTRGLHVDDRRYQHAWAQADETSAAGLTAQLSLLLEAYGERKLRGTLGKLGGVLDAIVLATSHTPAELAADLGSDNITDDGDPV